MNLATEPQGKGSGSHELIFLLEVIIISPAIAVTVSAWGTEIICDKHW
jgi:hypothetical protein